MSSEPAIQVSGLSKCYHLYETPRDRLKEVIIPKLHRAISHVAPSLTGSSVPRYFREFWAIRGITFEVGKGETVGIIGRNGSGKSTLLQIICGTLTPTAGKVDVDGRIAALLELGAGFNPEFTGRENAFLNAAILGLDRAEIEARFPEIERFAELGEFIDRPVKTYSSGMYVRLAFSVAVNVDPKLLIVDEALSVGDIRFQAKCMNTIRRLREQGTTILFVSHDIGAVRTLCDRAIWLDQGQVRLAGDVFRVTSEYVEFLFADEDQNGGAVEAEAKTSNPEKLEPVNHWGANLGSITHAGIYDAAGRLRDHFTERETMKVVIRFRVPPNADPAAISVAFSIKSLAGNDLIVSSTWDDKSFDFTKVSGECEIIFRLKNQLNAGRYLLVAAIEDRREATIQYHEYIEGACYFSSLQDTPKYGLFLPDIEQAIVVEGM
ncbi:MAG: ABC transporter ATP-binding protein [Desulfuromonadales bacterium]|nr:ABC transporter ATP-binding protein [Desulfuromonadales bacterium]